MTKPIDIHESSFEHLAELQKLNPELKSYNTTELINYLLSKSIKREINKVEKMRDKIDPLDNDLEKIIEGKEKNIDKLNILETKG